MTTLNSTTLIAFFVSFINALKRDHYLKAALRAINPSWIDIFTRAGCEPVAEYVGVTSWRRSPFHRGSLTWRESLAEAHAIVNATAENRVIKRFAEVSVETMLWLFYLDFHTFTMFAAIGSADATEAAANVIEFFERVDLKNDDDIFSLSKVNAEKEWFNSLFMI